MADIENKAKPADDEILPDDVIFDDALDGDDTLEKTDLSVEPELISTDLDALDNESEGDAIDDDDNAYGESDEALPDEGEERELLRDPSGEATRFGERVR